MPSTPSSTVAPASPPIDSSDGDYHSVLIDVTAR